ncbi:Sulfoquinovosyl transferase SQD2 [Nymphon striatum]|nr:Sulfoquinovosyl transferase SQD2 [Nymphon striatum]
MIVSQFNDFIVAVGYEDQIVEKISGYFENSFTNWSFADFEYLLKDSLIAKCFSSADSKIIKEEIDYGVRFTVSDMTDFEQYQSQMGKRWSKMFTKKTRLLERDGTVTTRTTDTVESIDESFALLSDMHSSRWSDRTKLNIFDSELFRTFHLEATSSSVCNEIGESIKKQELFDFMFSDKDDSYKKEQYAASSEPMYRKIMHIAHVIEPMEHGVFIWVVDMANRLVEDGYKVSVLHSIRENTPANWREMFDPRVDLIHVQMSRSIDPVMDLKALIGYWLGGTIVACGKEEYEIIRKDITNGSGKRLIRIINEKRNDVEFIWIGGGEDDDVEMLTKAGVEVTGMLDRNEALKLIPTLDIYFQTSAYEGLSLALLEAQASGIPAVVTKIPGNDEVVQQGKTGYVGKDENDLMVRLEELIDSKEKREEMGVNSKQHTEEFFSLTAMADQYKDEYQKMVDAHS